jgi:hypothetical protein
MREVKICAVHKQKKLREMIVELLWKGISATETPRREIQKPIKLRGGFIPITEDIENSHQLGSRLAWSIVVLLGSAPRRFALRSRRRLARAEGQFEEVRTKNACMRQRATKVIRLD